MTKLRGGAASPDLDSDEALDELYRAHRPMLIRLAVFLGADRQAAEELVQDAFAGLVEHWHRLHDRQAALGYVRRCVVNATRNAHRRRGVVRRHLRVTEPDLTPDVDFALLLNEEHREVIAALRTLPQRQREVLVLRFWSELGEAEIADAMGIARGTVKSTASRALATLERLLKDTV